MELAASASHKMSGGGAAIFLVIYAVIVVFEIAAFWRVFSKAGHHGWAAIIPIYNAYTLCRVAGRPGWWWILLIIPVVGFVILIVVSLDVAKKFGKGAGFGIGLWLLSFIFYPILGFGSAQYQG